jgi:hypothetical protein
MALVINGSGTISGITAGGLPDGAVTADDLASTLDLSGKTVTLPSGTGGKVLQVVHNTYTPGTYSVTNTTSWYGSGLDATITPQSSSSTLLITAVFQIRFQGPIANDMDSYTGLFKGATLLEERRWIGDNLGKLGDLIWVPVTAVHTHSETSGSTSSRTYGISVRNNTSTQYVGFVPYRSGMTIMEIAA